MLRRRKELWEESIPGDQLARLSASSFSLDIYSFLEGFLWFCIHLFISITDVDSGDSRGRGWVGVSVPAEGRDLSVKLCRQHRHPGRPASQPRTERSWGWYTHTHIHRPQHSDMLGLSWLLMCVGRCHNFTGQGGPSNMLTKRLQTSEPTGLLNSVCTQQQWKEPACMNVKFGGATCDWQVQDRGGKVPESQPGGQRLGPAALHERGAPALCWWTVEPHLSVSFAASISPCCSMVSFLLFFRVMFLVAFGS